MGNSILCKKNSALAEAIRLWLTTKPGEIIGIPTVSGYPYAFINVLLTPENATALQDWIYKALTTQFPIALEVQYLEVVADPVERKWKIYGAIFAPAYAALANFVAGLNV